MFKISPQFSPLCTFFLPGLPPAPPPSAPPSREAWRGVGGVGWDKVGLCVARGLESTPPHDLIEIHENEPFLIRNLIRKGMLSIFRNSGPPLARLHTAPICIYCYGIFVCKHIANCFNTLINKLLIDTITEFMFIRLTAHIYTHI